MAKQITEKQVEKLVERLISRIDTANTKFLMGIGSSLDEISTLTPTKAHELVQMLKYGGKYEDLVKQIDKYTKLNINEINKIFSEYAKKDQMFYEQFYKYRNIPFIEYEKNQLIKNQTQALSNMVKNEMYNFTRDNVLGYSITDNEGRVQFLGLRETYNRVLDEALLNAGQGKETFDSAMSSILKDIGGKGLKTIQYESGRSMRLDSAVRMHLSSRLNELHNENQKVYAREFGADGIEISVHWNPAPDHADAQGKQFSISEFDKLQTYGVAKDYKGRTINLHLSGISFRPISELNCYHTIFPIVLGVSKPEYTDEQLEEINQSNSNGFVLDGKHYTNYEGTQLQRNLERKIREQKDIQILAKASNNKELIRETEENIVQYTRKYKELNDASGLPSKKDRLKVSEYKPQRTKNINSFIKSTDKNVNYLGTIDRGNDKFLNSKINEYRKSILNDNVENAYLIDKSGGVFKIKGTEGEVIIPEWLDQKDGIVIHNHLADKTQYSFSKEDAEQFLSKKMQKLYGDDNEYQYVIEKTKNTVSNIDQLSIDWKTYYNEIGDKGIDMEFNGNDYIMQKLAEKYKFIYERKKQKK